MNSNSSFKPLNTKIYRKSGPLKTPDYNYWKKFGLPVLVKEFGPIDYIDFSPVEPYYFAVTCSVRVQIYNPITKLVAKNLSRFRENAYGAVFRSDGKLLCCGGEEKNVKLFDVSSKNLLRLFKGHTAPVHRTFFSSDKSQIISYSDDKTVKLWDMATENEVITYSDHTDYVRAGATCDALPNVILSGGYDNTVKLYDTRTNDKIMDVNHGSPVESTLFLPTGGIFISAGGTEMKVWDLIAGGKLLANISQHHKTITCLRLASDNKRILSGSLDRQVKIYDVSTFKVVHSLSYPNAIISLGISKNDDTIVAGLVDGLVSISRREEGKDDPLVKQQQQKSYKFRTENSGIDTFVAKPQSDKFARHDNCLRKFEYAKALKMVLKAPVAYKTPDITVGVLQELMRRKALHRVFDSFDLKEITGFCEFLLKYITQYQFTRVLVMVSNIFLDVFENDIRYMPKNLVNQFGKLSELLTRELTLGDQLASVQGAMEMLLASATTNVEEFTKPAMMSSNLTPSADAQKNLVVNLT